MLFWTLPTWEIRLVEVWLVIWRPYGRAVGDPNHMSSSHSNREWYLDLLRRTTLKCKVSASNVFHYHTSLQPAASRSVVASGDEPGQQWTQPNGGTRIIRHYPTTIYTPRNLAASACTGVTQSSRMNGWRPQLLGVSNNVVNFPHTLNSSRLVHDYFPRSRRFLLGKKKVRKQQDMLSLSAVAYRPKNVAESIYYGLAL